VVSNTSLLLVYVSSIWLQFSAYLPVIPGFLKVRIKRGLLVFFIVMILFLALLVKLDFSKKPELSCLR
jgi:Zn-dependent protease with chaperone function